MKRLLISLLFGAASCTTAVRAPELEGGRPQTILARPEMLAESRRLIEARNSAVLPYLDVVIRAADSALVMKPLSVMQKETVPPSGDKHDYLSMAPYWWPDSTKPNGLPYVRRDGLMNPQTRIDHDGLRFGTMVNAVEALSLAYWFTGRTAYAEKAAALTRVWFIDPETRMNPNLRYAQAILGVTEGRGIGILDLRAFPRLLDALALIRSSGRFSSADEAAFRKWCGTYLDWVVNSANGKDERAQQNNHGTLYDMQAGAIALYLGRESLARELIEDDGRKRVDAQIAADGSQPLELERTRPIHYSLFNLDAFTALAELGRHLNVDLWHYRNPKGAGILAALDFIAPYATDEKRWTKPDIAPIEREERSIALRRAGTVLRDAALISAANRATAAISREELFYPGRWMRLDPLLDHALDYAMSRLRKSAYANDSGFPRSTAANGHWEYRPYNQWTSGFFAGTLWQMYQLDRNPEWMTLAHRWMSGLERAASITTTHDLGFMVYNSFAPAYLLRRDTVARNVVLQASRSLASRYDSKVGAIKSWDTYGGNDARREWKYPVIIDNLMNLRLLFQAAEWRYPELKQIAEQHALTSARVHVRSDGSTAHVALFDPETGRLERTTTWQGYSDSSVWARGQAWAIYGYTDAYTFTRNPQLLNTAERVADWFVGHLPADGIPYWDFRDPAVPNTLRDASAAAIAASGLLELSRWASPSKAIRYRQTADAILHTLSRSYLTEGTGMASILAHSVGGKPQNSEVDVGLVYADYYFVEALLRERGIFTPR
jgi:unsaturated chondroitin disaccharide hydrolase